MIDDTISTCDYVRIRTTGERGRVYQRWAGSSLSPYTFEWLSRGRRDITERFGPEPQRFLNASWVGVLTHPNGLALWMPVDLLERIEPFNLEHYDYTYYFTDRYR